MTSVHHRSVSNNERRSGVFGGPTSRVNSIRARDYERPSARESVSPKIPDAYEFGQDGANGFVSPETVVERRREKNTITTTERLTTRRSPQKHHERNYGRDDPDRQRRDVVSPISRGKQKEEVRGMPCRRRCSALANSAHSSMGTCCISETTFFRSACNQDISSSIVINCSRRASAARVCSNEYARSGSRCSRRSSVCLHGL
jgi:hypothetical protein